MTTELIVGRFYAPIGTPENPRNVLFYAGDVGGERVLLGHWVHRTRPREDYLVAGEFPLAIPNPSRFPRPCVEDHDRRWGCDSFATKEETT